MEDSKAIEEMRAYNIRDERIEGEEAKKIASAHYLEKPVCIGADGLSVMDDVHEMRGYAGFLREMHESEREAREELRSWARSMGWTGGMAKVFGRLDVIEILGITERPASTLLGKMYLLGLTERITGAEKVNIGLLYDE